MPRLVLQGTRDTFGSADELTADLAAADAADEVVVVPLPGADHGFKTPAGAAFRPADLRALVVASTATPDRVGDIDRQRLRPGIEPAPTRCALHDRSRV